MTIHISTSIDDERHGETIDGVRQYCDFGACPECSMSAVTYDWGRIESTDGPIDHVRVTCINRHWFLMPADKLT
jgi:hypothetical protein